VVDLLKKRRWKMQFRKLLIAVIAVGMLGSVARAEEPAPPRQLGWDDLKVKVEFEDPFEALTSEQLMELSIYARVTGLRKRDAAKVSEAMLKEAEDAKELLKKQGVDVPGLLARREEIKELRKKRASAMDDSLDGVAIKMPGYALPLEYDGKKVKEFLLVPWVGACIHTPPPPPNQIVHVSLDEGVEVKSRYQPVWVTGVVSVGAVNKNLYLVDGSAEINIGYSIKGAAVEAYKPAAKPETSQANRTRSLRNKNNS
jgi:hypothetical protein